MSRTRKPQALRSKEILDAALMIAAQLGLDATTREAVAKAANVSTGLVSRHFTTMAQLRRAVMRAAIEHEVLPVVAEGLARRDVQAMKAPDDLKDRALATLRG